MICVYAHSLQHIAVRGTSGTEPSSQSVTTKNAEGTLVPMFAQLCLKQIWDVYAAAVAKDTVKLDKVFQVLNITVPPRDLRTQVWGPQLCMYACLRLGLREPKGP